MGSPIGLSFDLNSLSEGSFSALKNIINEFKSRREFYMKALCHILSDTDSITVLQYRSEDLKDCEIIAFTKKIMQDSVTVYPIVDESLDYILEDGRVISGKSLNEDGVDVSLPESFSSVILRLKAVE